MTVMQPPKHMSYKTDAGSVNSLHIWVGIVNGDASCMDPYRGRMPWDALFGTRPKAEAISSMIAGGADNEDALLAFIDRAVADGHFDILATFKGDVPFGGSTLPMPIPVLLQKVGYHRILAKFVAAGFDPECLDCNGQTAIEVAETWGNIDAASMMRAAVTRRHIQATLESVDQGLTSPGAAP